MKSKVDFFEQSTEIYRLAIESSQIGLWHWNLRTNHVDYNEQWCSILGIKLEDIDFHFSTWEKYAHPQDQEIVKEIIDKYLKGNIQHFEVVFRMKHTEGHWVYILSKGKIIERDEEGNPIRFMGTHQDMTRQKKLEEELEKQKLNALQSSKLAALGEMAGGVAHEINNPLAIIKGYCEQLEYLSVEKRLTHETLSKITGRLKESVRRIASIIEGLRIISRDGSNDIAEVINVKELIENSIDLCRERFTQHGVSIKIDGPENEVFIKGRLTELSQVVLNLLYNSFDAIEEKNEKFVKIEYFTKNKRTLIKVFDSGDGIPYEIEDKVFNPFFTTKSIGRATGLGLSLCQSVIKSHEGKIFVNPDKRSCIIIDIPAFDHDQKKKGAA